MDEIVSKLMAYSPSDWKVEIGTEVNGKYSWKYKLRAKNGVECVLSVDQCRRFSTGDEWLHYVLKIDGEYSHATETDMYHLAQHLQRDPIIQKRMHDSVALKQGEAARARDEAAAQKRKLIDGL